MNINMSMRVKPHFWLINLKTLTICTSHQCSRRKSMVETLIQLNTPTCITMIVITLVSLSKRTLCSWLSPIIEAAVLQSLSMLKKCSHTNTAPTKLLTVNTIFLESTVRSMETESKDRDLSTLNSGSRDTTTLLAS